LLTLMAALLRMNRQRILALALLAGAGAAVYLHRYVGFGDHGSPLQVLFTNPLGFVHYVLLFLGNPFYYVANKTSELIPVVAALFLIGSIVFFAHQLWRAPTTSSLPLSLLMFILFICISAAAAAGSRINEGLTQALTARYTTPTTVTWLSLLILYAPIIHKQVSESASRIFWYFLLILLLLLPLQFKALRSVADRNAGFNLAALALTLGIRDTAVTQIIYPYENRVAMLATKALDKKMSVFAQPPFNDARQRLGQIEKERTDQRCAGALQMLIRIDDDTRYYQLRGWLEGPDAGQAPATIRILDTQGTVVGFALSGFTRTDAAQPETFFDNHSGFVGYVQAEQLNNTIVLMGKDPDCELNAMLTLTNSEGQAKLKPFAASTKVINE